MMDSENPLIALAEIVIIGFFVVLVIFIILGWIYRKIKGRWLGL